MLNDKDNVFGSGRPEGRGAPSPSRRTEVAALRTATSRFGRNLLSILSQFLTFVFQSQVCLSISKASPTGQRTEASLVTPFSPPLSHLHTAQPHISLRFVFYSWAVLLYATSHFIIVFANLHITIYVPTYTELHILLNCILKSDCLTHKNLKTETKSSLVILNSIMLYWQLIKKTCV